MNWLKFVEDLFGGKSSQPTMWKQPTHEVIQVDNNGNAVHYYPSTNGGNNSSPTPTVTPQVATPTPKSSQTKSSNKGVSLQDMVQDPSFRFAFEKYQNPTGFNPQQPPAYLSKIIQKTFPNEATMAALLAATENAKYNPNAENLNDYNGHQSLDRGIFQVNSDSFNGLLKRRNPEMQALGINNFNQMFDPNLNSQVAKMILDEGGPGRWFGWQNKGYDLNNGNYTLPGR